MNRIDFIKFREAIVWEFRFLRKRLSHGETTIKVDFNGVPVVLLSVSEFSPSMCDPCFNQLICTIRETIRAHPKTMFVNQCLFYREEPVELMRLTEGLKLKKMMEESHDRS